MFFTFDIAKIKSPQILKLSSISSKVDYLITNDTDLNDLKIKEALALGIELITERSFNDKIGREFIIEKGVLFMYCGAKTDVTIPDKVTKIGKLAFYNCTSLTSVTIPDGVTTIDSSTFWRCTSLTNITIPDSVTKICDSAFSCCTNLTSITIPDSVTKICYWTFSGCTSLTNIIIPDSVTEIDSSAFSGCTSLTIHAPAGSYAEQYAKENNIPFVAE